MRSPFRGENSHFEEWVGGAYGKRLDDDWPEGVLAVLDTQWQATDERIERARMLFEQASLDDFEPLGSTGRRWLHRESQVEFVLDESMVFDAADPSGLGIVYFALHGWRLLFFRRSDHDPVRVEVHGTFSAGRVTHDARGEEVIVPAKNFVPFIPR